MDLQTKNVRVAAYLRVSTDEQVEKSGLETQMRHIQSFVDAYKHQGWVLDKRFIYKDDGYSGTLATRPALDRMMHDAKNNKFDVIVVWKIDRFYRSMRLLLETMEKLVSFGVGFKSLSEPFDTTPVGKFIMQMFGALAEFERNLILERTREGKITTAKDGKYVGGNVPYGYKVDDRQHLVVIKEEAKWVSQVFDWFVNDRMSTVGIAGKLIEFKIPGKWDTGRKSKRRVNPANFWHVSSIWYMLRRTHYIGEYFYNRTGKDKDGNIYNKPENEWTRLPCPSIVDRKIYFKAQKLLSENNKSNNAQNKYLLSGKIQCGDCGSNFTGYVSMKKTKNYRCGKTNPTKTSVVCKARNISENIIADKVWEVVKDFFKKPKPILKKMEADYKKHSYYHSLLKEKEHLEKRLVKNQNGHANVRRLLRDDDYTPEVAKEELSILDRDLSEITESLEALNAQLKVEEEQEEKIESIKELAKKYQKNLQNITYEDKYIALQGLLKRIIITGDDIQLQLYVPRKIRAELTKLNYSYGSAKGN